MIVRQSDSCLSVNGKFARVSVSSVWVFGAVSSRQSDIMARLESPLWAEVPRYEEPKLDEIVGWV